MVILISIVISASIDSVEETNITKIENEIKDLTEAVNIRISNYERNSTTYPIIGEKIGDSLFEYIRSIEMLDLSEITEIINKIAVIYNDETKDFFRLVGRTEAEKLGVEGIDVEHYYIVNYYECEVYGPVSLKLINNGG